MTLMFCSLVNKMAVWYLTTSFCSTRIWRNVAFMDH